MIFSSVNLFSWFMLWFKFHLNTDLSFTLDRFLGAMSICARVNLSFISGPVVGYKKFSLHLDQLLGKSHL